MTSNGVVSRLSQLELRESEMEEEVVAARGVASARRARPPGAYWDAAPFVNRSETELEEELERYHEEIRALEAEFSAERAQKQLRGSI